MSRRVPERSVDWEHLVRVQTDDKVKVSVVIRTYLKDCFNIFLSILKNVYVAHIRRSAPRHSSKTRLTVGGARAFHLVTGYLPPL